MLKEINFPPNKRKGTFFPDLTMFHHFVVIGLGRNELVHLLRPYNMVVSSKRLNDMEGFYVRLMKRISLPSRGAHEFEFPKEIIRNGEDMKSQRNKKSYWHTYQDMVHEIKESDPSYNPFPNYHDSARIIRIALRKFPEIYDMLNEKLGYGKKVKLTIVQEKEDLDKLI